jgi:hypothetical protein
MATRLIKLDDETYVEVEAQPNQPEQISAHAAAKVEATMEHVQGLLVKACRPVVAAWQELNKEMNIEAAEIEMGLSFEGEGNLYITKAKTGANLLIRLKLKPMQEEHATR